MGKKSQEERWGLDYGETRRYVMATLCIHPVGYGGYWQWTFFFFFGKFKKLTKLCDSQRSNYKM